MLAAIAPTALLCMQVISFYEEIIFEWIQNVIQNQIRKEQKVFRPLKKKKINLVFEIFVDWKTFRENLVIKQSLLSFFLDSSLIFFID